MKYRHSQPGYLMVFTLMLIGIIMVLITTLADRSSVHVRYVRTMIDREKAKALAWSGVQIAMSQLATMHEPAEKEEEAGQQREKNPDPVAEKRMFLQRILPVINSWQEFKVTKKNDGTDGIIKMCIGCEEGKLNINKLFSFVHKKFVGQGERKNDAKKALQEVFAKLKEKIGGDELFAKFEKFLKERQNKLYDPTELLTIKEFERFKDAVFYAPRDGASKDQKDVKQTIYLQDLFTLWSGSKELNPWLLSHSLKVLLGLKIRKKGDEQLKQKALQAMLKEFKVSLVWPASWNKMLAPLYGVKFESLPKELRALMSTKFEPKVFSVLSYGSVGDVTQRLLVIVEKTQSSTTEQSGSASFEFKAKKFYWL